MYKNNNASKIVGERAYHSYVW